MKRKIIVPIIGVLSLSFISYLVNKDNTYNDLKEDFVESTEDYLNEKSGIERFNLKIAWDIDLKTRLAGGTPKEEAKDWTQDLYKN